MAFNKNQLEIKIDELTSLVEGLRKEVKKLRSEQQKSVQSIKAYIKEELTRRDEWEKQAAETKMIANGREVWVIKCPSPDGEEKVRWGDYHYAVALKKYLERQGLYVLLDNREDWSRELEADVVIVLRGSSFYRPDRRNKAIYIMWNISHPDWVTIDEYQLYDIVCISSDAYVERIKNQVTVPVYSLLQCTDTEVFCPGDEMDEIEHEYLFVGNSRGIARESVVWAAEAGLDLDVYGGGWGKILADHKDCIKALELANELLPYHYRHSKVTLNDHWQDMLDNGFVNNRIFDALACGLPVISDCNNALKEIFPDAVLYFNNREEFNQCVEQIENNYDAVKARVVAQREMIVKEYSFERRAQQFVELVKNYRAKQI